MISPRTNLILRFIFDIILFFGVFAFPFWAQVLLAFIGLIYFKNFYEFIIVFALGDLLYAIPEQRFFGGVYMLTIFSTVIFLIASFIKNKIFITR